MRRSMIVMIVVSVFMLLAVAMPAVAVEPNNVIKGKMDIDFKSLTQTDDSGKPLSDVYKLDVQVTGLLQFQGSIERKPDNQGSMLTYNVNLLVGNPKNPADKKISIGKVVGTAPVNKQNVYNYNNGNLRIGVDPRGGASGFESKFRGVAKGKPPKESLVQRIKKAKLEMMRYVKGKSVRLVVTDYDIMEFEGLVMAAGPVRTYPEATVSGKMVYDREREAWYFYGLTIAYQTSDGKAITDKLTGNIKWVADPQRATNGKGRYEFNVHFNEPEQKSDEAAVFKPVDDESAFFATDTTIPSLTGMVEYKDQMSGETVTASAVTIDLVSNNLTRQQVVNAFKLIFLVSVVPMNSE